MRRDHLLHLALLLVCALLVQWGSGAYHSECSADSDEPAHIVTGLMVQRYVKDGIGQPPIQFARDFYLHYPKVALGHWPPLFYAVQAVWTLAIPFTRAGLLVLMALLSALVALGCHHMIERRMGRLAAWCSCVLLLTLPAVGRLGSRVSTEMLMAVLILGAVWAMGEYLETSEWRYSAMFGCLAAAALLGKGSGAVLAPIPALGVILTRRWDLVKRPSFWLPLGIVLAVAGPWYALAPAARHERVAAMGGARIVTQRLGLPPAVWAPEFGWAAAILATVGLIWCFIEAGRGQRLSGLWASSAALVVSATTFPVVVAVWERRHQVEAAAGFILMAALGTAWIGSKLRLSARQGATALVLGTCTLGGWNLAHITKQPVSRYGNVVEALMKNGGSSPRGWMIVSDALGEGIFVKETAVRERQPETYVVRGSKALSNNGWMGSGETLKFTSDEELAQLLSALPLDAVVLDRKRSKSVIYAARVEALLATNSNWRMWERSDLPEFAVYLRAASQARTAEEMKEKVSRIFGNSIP